MSIKHGILALLREGERYGYQLRAEFEARTGSTWPLNVGQVYSTLARLERDGLVEPTSQDEQGHAFYRITDAGRTELIHWFANPVARADRPRDELAVKLALAVTVPEVNVRDVVQTQRTHTFRTLQDYTKVKAGLGEDELAFSLVLESLIFQAEAEIRWLDHVEARVARHATRWSPPRAQTAESTDENTDAEEARR